MTLPQRPLLKLRPSLMALALGVAFTSSVQAQSLKELYEAARGYDATYLAIRAQTESAEYRTEQARALKRPAVQFDASLGRSIADTPSSPSVQYQASNALGGTFSGKQSLFNAANNATISQAERAYDLARAQLRGAEQDLIVRVAQAYFDVLASQDALATVQSSKKAISEQLASAKRNFEVGTATITDTREAQARYDLATAQELAAQNDLRVKQVALDQQVGRNGVAPKPLALPVAVPPVQPASMDAWVRNAETQSPAIQQAAIGLDVAKLETEKARAGHLPTVGLSANYGKTYARNDLMLASGPLNRNGTSTNTSIGVGVSVPLFAGYSVQNRIKETLKLEDKAASDLDFARRAVTQATRTAFLGLQSGQSQVLAYEAAESSSKLALEATQTGYRVGVRVNLDVLNAQAQLFTTQRDLAKARYDLIVNSLRLRQASGVLTPGDVDAVSALIAP
ncbi:MAG: TolC family outer membrane protein [Burkholderiales bacterium]